MKKIITGLFACSGDYAVCANPVRMRIGSGAGTEVFSMVVKTMILAGLVCSGLWLKGQNATLTLENTGICEPISIRVPITGNNLTNVGAITLFMTYNDTLLTFNSIQNLHPQLDGIIVNTLTNPARVALVWSKTSGATFMNDTLLCLEFDIIPPARPNSLNFIDSICEFASVSIPPQVLSVSYYNGTVFLTKPSISSEPENKEIKSQSNAVFQVSSPDATTYIWQESRNSGVLWTNLTENATYNGTQSNTLTIHHVPSVFDQYNYRCILNPVICPVISATAVLSVDSITGITTYGSPLPFFLKNTPNPFSGTTILEYTVPENGFVTIKIFSMTGELMDTPVKSLHKAGYYRAEENFIYLPAGIYFCQFVFRGPARIYETYRKLVKIK